MQARTKEGDVKAKSVCAHTFGPYVLYWGSVRTFRVITYKIVRLTSGYILTNRYNFELVFFVHTLQLSLCRDFSSVFSVICFTHPRQKKRQKNLILSLE